MRGLQKFPSYVGITIDPEFRRFAGYVNSFVPFSASSMARFGQIAIHCDYDGEVMIFFAAYELFSSV